MLDSCFGFIRTKWNTIYTHSSAEHNRTEYYNVAAIVFVVGCCCNIETICCYWCCCCCCCHVETMLKVHNLLFVAAAAVAASAATFVLCLLVGASCQLFAICYCWNCYYGSCCCCYCCWMMLNLPLFRGFVSSCFFALFKHVWHTGLLLVFAQRGTYD